MKNKYWLFILVSTAPSHSPNQMNLRCTFCPITSAASVIRFAQTQPVLDNMNGRIWIRDHTNVSTVPWPSRLLPPNDDMKWSTQEKNPTNAATVRRYLWDLMVWSCISKLTPVKEIKNAIIVVKPSVRLVDWMNISSCTQVKNPSNATFVQNRIPHCLKEKRMSNIHTQT